MIMFWRLAATALALLVLTSIPRTASTSLAPVALVGVIAFCLLGPYSYLAGAFALDFGGKQAGAASSGVIEGVGYLGGAVAGDSVARIAVAFGCRSVFVALAVVSTLAAGAAAYLFFY
jgi:sugar phosphate permease